jgi:Xaa-Pro aminopeptidase
MSIPKLEYKTRLRVVRDRIRYFGYVGLLAISGYAERDGNVCYLCGHKNAFPHSMRTETISGLGYSALLIPSHGETTLIAPLGYQADVVVGVDKTKTGTNLALDLTNSIKESLPNSGILALAGSDILPAVYVDEVRRSIPDISIEFRDDIIADQRMIKSSNELRLLKKASRIADKAVWAAVDSIKPGMTESAIGSVARKTAMDAGADYVVRDRIQSGFEKMKGIRWPFASRKKVRKGELVSIDFVGWVDSYGFDILRMGCVGRPNREQRMLIELADEATHAMSNALVAGGDVRDSIAMLSRLERPRISISPFGHTIGLEIVEKPYLFPGASGELRENMVFCVEPDVRSAKEWACVENEVVVTAGKPETITKLPVDFWN